ncbi:MAG: hypothetical protein QOI65_606 [Thermoleophilaceae bacterium]|nr:hypothetical protein [Thermoleophilaceae bacterium]
MAGRGLVTGLVVLVGLWLAPGEAVGAGHSCSAKRTRVLAANSRIRVLRRTGGGDEGSVYACLGQSGEWVRLGRSLGASRVYPVRITDALVAYGSYCACPATSARLIVRDMRRHGLRLIGRELDGRPTDLVLAPDGAVAWIEGSSPTFPVWKSDGDGAAQVDDGDDVAPESLALSSRTVYWTKAGAPYSTSLAAR